MRNRPKRKPGGRNRFDPLARHPTSVAGHRKRGKDYRMKAEPIRKPHPDYGPSPYTIEPTEQPHTYLVRDTRSGARAGRTWTVDGFHGETTQQNSAAPLPVYVSAAVERRNACDELRRMLKPGDTLHTILRHVSSSGMFRRITVVKLEKDGPRYLDYYVAQAIGEKLGEQEGIPVGGAGMDMGFEIIYRLGFALWPEGYRCPGKSCGDADHNNPPFPKRDGRMKHHHGGGYALHHRWLA